MRELHQSGEIQDQVIIAPSMGQLFQITWSVLWRYMVISLLFILLIYGLYSQNIDFVIRFFNFAQKIGELVSTSGYSIAIQRYPIEILLWFLLRSLFGFLITYLIFTQIISLKYRTFDLNLVEPETQRRDWHGIFKLSWSFYWRLYTILMILFLTSILFMSPSWMVMHIGLLSLYFIFLGMIVILYILKNIINRPFKGFILQTTVVTKPYIFSNNKPKT